MSGYTVKKKKKKGRRKCCTANYVCRHQHETFGEILRYSEQLHVWVLSHSAVSDSLWPCPEDCRCQTCLSMWFSRQEHWIRVAISSSRGSSRPGIKPSSPEAHALAGRFFTIWATMEALPTWWSGLQRVGKLGQEREIGQNPQRFYRVGNNWHWFLVIGTQHLKQLLRTRNEWIYC